MVCMSDGAGSGIRHCDLARDVSGGNGDGCCGPHLRGLGSGLGGFGGRSDE